MFRAVARFAGLHVFLLRLILGLAPQALCCRPLRGLDTSLNEQFLVTPGFMLSPASRACMFLLRLILGLAPQALCCRPLRGLS